MVDLKRENEQMTRIFLLREIAISRNKLENKKRYGTFKAYREGRFTWVGEPGKMGLEPAGIIVQESLPEGIAGPNPREATASSVHSVNLR